MCARRSRTGPRCASRPCQLVTDLEAAAATAPGCGSRRRGGRCCSWLADDHFTFLGYREYQLQTVEGEDVLRAIPGTGLGILRSRPGHVPVLRQATSRGAGPRHAKKQLLIITKANSRSTVHRPVYLDYVGVKIFRRGR
ncbi:MAG: hypothetical protein WKF82_05110 [Nocardioidaceae bacterium]